MASLTRSAIIARYYDPATAQFLTVDPMVAITLSPYGYVAGDPVNVSDPSGQGGLSACAVDSPQDQELCQEMVKRNEQGSTGQSGSAKEIEGGISLGLGAGGVACAIAEPCGASVALGLGIASVIVGIFSLFSEQFSPLNSCGKAVELE
jgi:hypothetical protein